MMEKQLIPQLRFPEFEGNWGFKKYNEIYTFYSTNSLSREKLNYENGEVKNIHYGDIHTKFATLFDIEKEEVPFVNPDVDLTKLKDENFCQEGDLLIADASEDYNDIGKTTEIISLNNERLISGLHTFHARPNKHKMAIGFAGYSLQTWRVRKQVMTIAQGTKVLGLATSRLGEINLVISQLPEQQKIASFLSDVDEKITKLTQKKALLEHYKKGVIQKIFNQELRFKDDEGNAFPDWEEKEIKKIAKVVGGGTPSTTEEEYWNGEINWFTPTEIKFNYVSESNRKITQLGLKKSSATLLPKGAILLTTRATIGEVALAKKECTTNQGFQSLVVNKQNSNLFVFNLIKVYRNELYKRANGSTFKEISKKEIETIKVLIPTLEEQTKIANFLSNIDLKIVALNTQIENSKSFKKGLLQKMFV